MPLVTEVGVATRGKHSRLLVLSDGRGSSAGVEVLSLEQWHTGRVGLRWCVGAEVMLMKHVYNTWPGGQNREQFSLFTDYGE